MGLGLSLSGLGFRLSALEFLRLLAMLELANLALGLAVRAPGSRL